MPRYFTSEHEWIVLDRAPAPDCVATVGLTDHGQALLGDVTYVELPEAGRAVARGEAVAVVDSVKAASDVRAPVSGTVSAANPVLGQAPDLVNTDAEAGGWLFRMVIADPAELDLLMDQAAYDAFVAGS